MANFFEIEPNKDLEFRKPFNDVVKQTINIKNILPDCSIAFKVKTTAPKHYCVRPNLGRISPNSSAEVNVMLQAMTCDPPDDAKCKDKFLVQAIKIPEDLMKISKEDAQEKLQELWAIAELSKKTDSNSLTGIICEKRLKCVYLPSLESRNAVTHNDSKSQSFFDYRQKGSQLPNVQPSSSLSDLTEKELKETIKKLSAACEGYKAEIDRLNDLRKSKVLNEKGGEISTQSGATVALSEISGIKPLDAFLISLVAFLIEKELMSTSKSLVIDHWDDTVVEEDTYTQNPVTVITESSRSEYKPQIKLLQRKPEVAVSNKMETRTVSKPKEKTKEERELEYKLTREKIFNEKDEKLSSRNNSKLEEKKTTDHWDDS